jgi:hypothetical protein
MGKRKSKTTLPTSFMAKTFDMVSNRELSKVIGWSEDGCAIVIRDMGEFTDTVLPRYFKHNNYASFVRQLNMYDFHKCRVDGQENAFIQPLFLKDSRHLLSDIKRKVCDLNCALIPVTAAQVEAQSILVKLQNIEETQEAIKEDVQSLQVNYEALQTNTSVIRKLAAARDRGPRFNKILMVLDTWIHNPYKQLEASDLFEAFLPIATEESTSHPFSSQSKVNEVKRSQSAFKDDLSSLMLSPLVLPESEELTDDFFSQDVSFNEMLP